MGYLRIVKKLLAILICMSICYPANAEWRYNAIHDTDMDYYQGATTLSATFLKLDQTTHQHILNDYPRFDAGFGILGNYGLYWRDVADANTVAYISYDGDLTIRPVTGDLILNPGGGDINCMAANLTTTGIISGGADLQTTHILGQLKIGDVVGLNDYAGIAHYDNATLTNYALVQDNNGLTAINCAVGQEIDLRIGNDTFFRIYKDGGGTKTFGPKVTTNEQINFLFERSGGTGFDAYWYNYIPASSTDLRWYNGSDLMTLTAAGALTVNGTLGAGAITGTSFTIGANTLTTAEWAFLDGQDQAVKTTSSPTFAAVTTTGNITLGVAGAGYRTLTINSLSGAGATVGTLYTQAYGFLINSTQWMSFIAPGGFEIRSGGTFYWQDSDAANATRMALDSAGGFLSLNGPSDPYINISEGASTTSWTRLIDASANQFIIYKRALTGNVLIDISPLVIDGTGTASFRFFRDTTTSGLVSFSVFKGDGTNTVNSLFAGNSNSYINAVTGNIGIGFSGTPAVKLHQDQGNATATYHKFTAGTTTGLLSTDGFDVGIDASANAELRQRENLPLYFYTNNTLRATLEADGDILFAGAQQFQFRDSAIYAYSSADGWLNLVADTGVEVNAPILNTAALYVAGAIDAPGLPTGTLVAPPAGLGIGDLWLDSTDSAQYPIVRQRAS